ncbi:uncharacterized protein Jupiter isoform X3 [Planococcus citri]|uniref:uncharacterized protein Jupiter isoform X3 n=1 Tax=Planococcus citri TaxID=170843 RepID=UPI0031F9E0ED
MSVNCEKRTFKSPGGDCHDLFGAEFIGSPCHHRVLKPPGGGSSDIFGKDGGPEQPVIRKKSQQSSSIVLNDEVTPAPIENGHSNKQDAPKTNGVPVTNGKAPSEAPKPVVSNAGNAAPRQRVPPGGFSSGLW